jgi:hypothetical protein
MNFLKMTINCGSVSKVYTTQYVPQIGQEIDYAWDQLKGRIQDVRWIRLNEVVITLDPAS